MDFFKSETEKSANSQKRELLAVSLWLCANFFVFAQ